MDLQISGGNAALSLLVGLAGLLVTVFWIVVGWRAMRAHEEIADALREWTRKSG